MSTSNLPLTKVCRLCLALSRTYIDIVENEEISLMLATLTSIKVELDDQISTKMCLKCKLNLHLAYKIQQNMLQAEERFHLLKVKSQSVDEYMTNVLVEDECEIKEEILQIEDESVIQNRDNTETEIDDTKSFNLDLSCETCGKIFPSKTLLYRHKYFHKKAKCPICSKEVTASNLHTHMEIHTDDPQICDICGVTLKTKGNLRQHKFYSHNAARHKCEYCDKVFVKKTSRDSHQRKEHLDKADYVCDTCGKKFYAVRNLNTHVKMTHLKLRPYVCDFCNCGFSSIFAMKTHRRQHTNETPYRCEVCGEGFRQKVSLRSHRKSKHNITEKEVCKCPVCGKGFASKTALYTHQRIH